MQIIIPQEWWTTIMVIPTLVPLAYWIYSIGVSIQQEESFRRTQSFGLMMSLIILALALLVELSLGGTVLSQIIVFILLLITGGVCFTAFLFAVFGE